MCMHINLTRTYKKRDDAGCRIIIVYTLSLIVPTASIPHASIRTRGGAIKLQARLGVSPATIPSPPTSSAALETHHWEDPPSHDVATHLNLCAACTSWAADLKDTRPYFGVSFASVKGKGKPDWVSQ